MTAHDVWEKLIVLYAELSIANGMRLYDKMLTLRLGDRNDARTQVYDMRRTRTQLSGVFIEVKDMLYKFLLLYSLSTKFDNLSMALETNIDTISVEELHARIFRKEKRPSSVFDADARALRLHDIIPKRDTVCFFCKKKGHKISSCRIDKKSEQRNEGLRNEGLSDDPRALTLHAMKFRQSTWVVGASAGYHICRD